MEAFQLNFIISPLLMYDGMKTYSLTFINFNNIRMA